MPEIPEIETFCNHLRSALSGRTITAVMINRPKSLNVSPQEFTTALIGQSISSVHRRAKIILLTFPNNYTILIHFMLEGYAQLLSLDDQQLSHASVIFQLDNRQAIAFFRMNLGYLHLFPTTNHEKIDELANLGPEPLSADFTLERFFLLISKRKGMIKPLLMDQKFIAGIGNAYSNEILFCSRILPDRKVSLISTDELTRLYNCLQSILRQATALGGIYDVPFSSIDTITGKYTSHLQVAYRTGEPCTQCRHPIETKRVGGRNAFYCSMCQK